MILTTILAGFVTTIHDIFLEFFHVTFVIWGGLVVWLGLVLFKWITRKSSINRRR